jgi:hypothetical protein
MVASSASAETLSDKQVMTRTSRALNAAGFTVKAKDVSLNGQKVPSMQKAHVAQFIVDAKAKVPMTDRSGNAVRAGSHVLIQGTVRTQSSLGSKAPIRDFVVDKYNPRAIDPEARP